jgi:hypothetical protein
MDFNNDMPCLNGKEDMTVNEDYFYNRTVIFFGDFDGGASICRLSKKSKLYWFSCEQRYEDLQEHSWCEGLDLRMDFKHYRERYFKCVDEKDFLRLAKKIRKGDNHEKCKCVYCWTPYKQR